MPSPEVITPPDTGAPVLMQPGSLHGRILMAMGDPQGTETFREALTQAGGEVRLARDGQSVLEAVAREMPELLLLGVSLPGTDCAAVIRQLKSADETRFLPVVIVMGPEDQPVAGLEAGADDFLRHTAAPAELVLRARLLLRLGRLHQDLADNNTELQAAYETARESEAKYRALIHEAQDALILVNPTTSVILEANRRAWELSGYQDDDLIGQPITMLCEEAPRSRWSELIAGVTSIGRMSLEAGTLRCKNGEVIPVEVQASLANHHLGEPLIQVLMRDIRPRQQLDRERAKSERLGAIVETAVTVNHEINNPLLVITSSVDALQQSLFEAESGVREKLEKISEACRRIQRFTQQLTSVIAPVSKEYLPGIKMLDIQQSVAADADAPHEL